MRMSSKDSSDHYHVRKESLLPQRPRVLNRPANWIGALSPLTVHWEESPVSTMNQAMTEQQNNSKNCSVNSVNGFFLGRAGPSFLRISCLIDSCSLGQDCMQNHMSSQEHVLRCHTHETVFWLKKGGLHEAILFRCFFRREKNHSVFSLCLTLLKIGEIVVPLRWKTFTLTLSTNSDAKDRSLVIRKVCTSIDCLWEPTLTNAIRLKPIYRL